MRRVFKVERRGREAGKEGRKAKIEGKYTCLLLFVRLCSSLICFVCGRVIRLGRVVRRVLKVEERRSEGGKEEAKKDAREMKEIRLFYEA